MSFNLTIIVIDEQSNTHVMPPEVFAERAGPVHKIGTALTHGVVEAFDVRGFTRLLANGTMSF